MNQKLISALLTLVMLFSLIPLATIPTLAASAGDTFNADNSDGVSLQYEVLTNTSNVKVISDYYSAADIKIPKTVSDGYDSYMVTEIGDTAFQYCGSLTSVTIPDSVTTIGDDAFQRCESLASVTIPDSVTTIGNQAFDLCTSLTNINVESGNAAYKSINGVLFTSDGKTLLIYPTAKEGTTYSIASGVTTIGDSAFLNCQKLTSVIIPNSVITIGDSAFEGCANLSNVTIPGSVTTISKRAFFNCTSLTCVTISNGVALIGDNVFYNCYSLTSLTIPDSVTTIGDDPFDTCTSLTSINVGTGNTAYKSIDGVLLTSDGKTLLVYPSAKEGAAYNIPAGVEAIGNIAFGYSANLTSVTIPSGVTVINSFAFYRCTSLTSVAIPNSVTTIGEEAFARCTRLGSVTIPSSVNTIGGYAFYNCTSLAAVYFDGAQPTTIGSSGFQTYTATAIYYRSIYAFSGSDFNEEGSFLSCGTKTITVSGITNGTVTPSTTNGIYGETITLAITPENGYGLKTLTAQDDSSNPITINDNYYFAMPDSAVTVSAEFAKIYTVIFDENSGDTSASPSTATALVGNTATLPTTNPIRSGYTFSGWNTAADGKGTSFTSSTAVTGDITVYAVWAAVPSITHYSVTFDTNGSDTQISSSSGRTTYGGTVTLPTTVPTRSGYVFEGWNTAADGSGTWFTADTVVKKSITVYAIYKKIPVYAFNDVLESSWYYEAVQFVVDKGLFNGTSDATFAPGGTMTRGMLVTVLYRMAGSTESDANPFADVPDGEYCAKAAAWAAQNSIVSGTGDGNFWPDAPVTRQQLAVMLWHYAKLPGYGVSIGDDTNILSYNDAASQISDYAFPALQWACGAGIINGDTKGNLNPKASATRAQVAVMLQRFFTNVIDKA